MDQANNIHAQKELDRLKGRFLSSLNHEMRTPLTGIIGMADLLRETTLSDEQSEYVSIIRSCADGLNDILNATLEFASLSSGRAHREDAPFELQPCLEVLAAEFSARAAKKGLGFHFRTRGELPQLILGDEIRLRALLTQLLSNAVKFTDTGRIELTVQGHGEPGGPQWLDIEILDTGIGISADKMGSIFESFQPGDTTREAGIVQQHAGLGLGLALARELAKLLEGEITVVSHLASGSVFRLRLPVHLPASTAAAEPKAPKAPLMLETGHLTHVLLVEDNRVSQRIVSHMLERAEFQVTCAASGMEAVRLAHEHRFDLVLMDLHMPGIDGIETTYRLRRIGGYRHVPVVALTANAGPEFRDLCRDHGLQGFLSKPVQAEELVRAIEECMDESKEHNNGLRPGTRPAAPEAQLV